MAKTFGGTNILLLPAKCLDATTAEGVGAYADAALLERIAEVRPVELPQSVVHVVPGPEVHDAATLVVLYECENTEPKAGGGGGERQARTHQNHNRARI